MTPAFAARWALPFALVGLIVACGHSGHSQSSSASSAAGEPGVVNLYTWADYMAPDTATAFEKQTGIKLRVAFFDNLEQLESKMLIGHSDFDVVVPVAAYISRQIRSGAYQALDKTRVPNLAGIDPDLMRLAAVDDPGNAYGAIYTWGTFGIGYNKKLVEQRLAGAPPNSWRLLFDPAYAAKLKSCGINFIDDPGGVVQILLRYLGREPGTPTAADLDAVEKALMRIRPYVRTIDTATEIESMANGDICVSLGYNGDFVQARKRALEAKNGIQLDYLLPEEGSELWMDMLVIPRDAPHLENAYKLIDFMLDPVNMAKRTNAIGYANGSLKATPLLDPEIARDPAIYPTPAQRQRMFMTPDISPENMRLIMRIWQRFKTGQ